MADATTAAASKDPPSKDEVRAENKRLEVQFKAQHGLMLAFFALILYAQGPIP